MTSLVTGASGFLGGHVVEALCNRGEKVVILARKTSNISAIKDLPIEVRYGDLTDLESVKRAAKGVDRIYHCAGAVRYVVPYDDLYRANVMSAQNVVIAGAGAGVTRIVHASSLGVSGPEGLMSPNDKDSYSPSIKEKYCRSKTEAEAMFFKECAERGVGGVALRPGVIYGPRDYTASFFWFKIVDSGKVVYIGDGTARFPLIYIEDLVRVFLVAGEKDGILGRAYNLDGPEEVCLKRLYDQVSKELGKHIIPAFVTYHFSHFTARLSEFRVALGGYKKEPGLSKFVVELFGVDHGKIDCSRARLELGFNPTTGIEDGIRRPAEWYKTVRGES
jgi:nucleoside-diphosphate-sugar epimerase